MIPNDAWKKNECGVALIICTIAMLLMMALGTALVVATSAETGIAANFRNVREGRYAASAAFERALGDLATVDDWSAVLDGSVRSGFVDGPPAGTRTLADGSTLDLARVVSLASCGRRVSACTSGQMDTLTTERPWGTNNPRWSLYAYGPLERLLSAGIIDSPYYLVVLVGDDQSENDSNPLVDGGGPGNPGRGVITVRAEAFGRKNAHHGIEATIARSAIPAASGTPRVLSWRTPARLDRP